MTGASATSASQSSRAFAKNQRIDGYFTDGTELEYEGDICSFRVTSNQFLPEVKGSSYVRPKIMYIPSERNLLTVLENADRIQKLPLMQNLFPASQIKILEELIRINGKKEGNRLLITTHSPYILSALNNYIYASEVHAKHGRGIAEIDEGLFLDINDIAAYKIEDGKISDIKNTEYNLIDTTEIDDCSSMINSAYDKLVSLDEE